MDDSELERVFSLMGESLKRGGSGGNHPVKCPLARWTHPKGKDSHASMTVKSGDPALFKCWACNEQGSVRKLAKLYMQNSGDDRAYTYAREVENFKVETSVKNKQYRQERARIGKQIQVKEKQENSLSEDGLKKFMEKVPNYVFERGITKEQIKKWELGYDEKEARLIIPVRDYVGKLAGVSGRALLPDTLPKYKHYYGLKKETVLYGENVIDRTRRRAYIVEGFTDVWGLERKGLKNVLCSMGTTLSDMQIQKLERWFSEVVFIPDFDHFGLKFAEIYGESILLKSKLIKRVGIVGVTKNETYFKREKPKDWEAKDFKYKLLEKYMGRDPDEFKNEELREIFNNLCWVSLY